MLDKYKQEKFDWWDEQLEKEEQEYIDYINSLHFKYKKYVEKFEVYSMMYHVTASKNSLREYLRNRQTFIDRDYREYLKNQKK